MKNNKLYIYLTLACLCAVPLQCKSATTLNQTILTTVPPAVNVAAVGGSVVSGTIDPSTGSNSGITGRFNLQTNGPDNSYDYVLQAALQSQGGVSTNAYYLSGSNPSIMLGNNSPSLYPTLAAVANVKNSPTQGGNPNVIAYPVTTTVPSGSSANFISNPTYNGYYFQILSGTNQNVAVSQSLGTAANPNTYSYLEDKPGTYQTVLTFSAFRKP